MYLRTQLRRAALVLPPVRRHYTAVLRQGELVREKMAEVDRLSAERERLAKEVAAVTEQHEIEREEAARQLLTERERLTAELAAVTGQREIEREEASHQLVAEQQRLIAETAAITAHRDALKVHLGMLQSENERQASRDFARVQQLEAQLQFLQQRQVTPADLDLLYSKLAAQTTRLSADLISRFGGRAVHGPESVDRANAKRYLDLLEETLTGRLVEDAPMSPWSKGYDPELRAIGLDWPNKALTMIGTTRMRNLRLLIERVLEENVPGDLLEAGVWRGGASIYMRGILAAHHVDTRMVWVADSFAGLPRPEPDAYPADQDDPHHMFKELVVPLEQVRANFARYGLLDIQVSFLQGWFADTLPSAPIERLAVLRMDGDMYSSTIQTLDALYTKVAPGGYVIVDDYNLPGCRKAITDFRDRWSITEEIEPVDGSAVYWRKNS
jgi:hypothetical protein